jgi:hypothetical protein
MGSYFTPTVWWPPTGHGYDIIATANSIHAEVSSTMN